MTTRNSGRTRAAAIMIVLGFFLCQVQARPPDWVAGLGKSARFPEERFFTGFGISTASDNAGTGAKIEEAKNNAKSALVEGIQVRVQVRNSDGTTARMMGGGKQELRSDYSSRVVSTSDVDLQGIAFEIYQARANQPVYALAWIDKEKVTENYRGELASRAARLEERQKQEEDFIGQGDLIGARELDGECWNTLDEIAKISATLEILGAAAPRERLTALKTRSLQLRHRVAERPAEADWGEGGLRLAFRTDAGGEKIRLRLGEIVTFFVRVNRPCYFHLLCRLSNSAWIIPDYRYWNYYFDKKYSNRDFALPDNFMANLPLGTDTVRAFISEEAWPDCDFSPRFFAGENYLAIPQGCIPAIVKNSDGTGNTDATHSILITTYR
ncbi:MAG: LPP20 family lipoprotein [Chitinivibrionales bacterium]|nr:LPP20 family lipoprotein [Chitinivibrionales bacterium]